MYAVVVPDHKTLLHKIPLLFGLQHQVSKGTCVSILCIPDVALQRYKNILFLTTPKLNI